MSQDLFGDVKLLPTKIRRKFQNEQVWEQHNGSIDN